MGKRETRGKEIAALDALIEEITIDAYGDDEQLSAFVTVIDDEVPLPDDAFVIGEPVSVLKIDYDGRPLRGLTARCRREDNTEYEIAAADILFPAGSEGARYIAAYRRWMGLDPWPAVREAPQRRKRTHKAKEEDLDLSGPVELIALSVKKNAIRCRLPGTDREITLRSGGLWKVVPGWIATVHPIKQWRFAGHPYLSGEIESTRLDVAALGLTPLRIEDQGLWSPKSEYWSEEGEPIEEWEREIIERGTRTQFEMEQVLQEVEIDDPLSDPISESVDLKEAGDYPGARKILMELLESDLRCLDAHAHLGNIIFDEWPEDAIRHYEAGVRIGELSLDVGFDGLLPWGFIDNRPFLRCMHGHGLCLWRLGRGEEAEEVFGRMLWFNPADNQGVRFLLAAVRSGEEWQDSQKHMNGGE